MAEKAKFELKEALEQFPEECKAIGEKLWEWLNEVDEPGSSRCLGVDMLIGAAARWLAGKTLHKTLLFIEETNPGGFQRYRWPNDMLRALLEEVREQLKREKDNADGTDVPE